MRLTTSATQLDLRFRLPTAKVRFSRQSPSSERVAGFRLSAFRHSASGSAGTGSRWMQTFIFETGRDGSGMTWTCLMSKSQRPRQSRP